MGKKQELIKEARRLELIQEAKALEAAQSMPKESFSDLEKTGHAVRSAAEGATFGLSEPVVSGVKAAGSHLQDVYEGRADLTDTENLSKEYEADVARRRLFESENPNLAASAEMAGAIAPMFFTGGASLLPRAVGATGKVATSALRAVPLAEKALKAEGLIGSAARIGEAGLSAATQAVAGEGLKQAVEVPTGFMKPEERADLTDIAKTGAIFGGSIKAVPEVLTQAGRAAKGAARVFTKVHGETIDKYLANPERIRNAKSIVDIKEEVDNAVNLLRDDFENAKLSETDAKLALKEAQSNLKIHLQENKSLINSEKKDLSDNLRRAERDLNESIARKKVEIKNARVPIQPDDVLDSVEKVKGQVNDLSEESYKILGLHKGRFNLRGITKQISQLQNELKVNGQLLSSDAEKADATLSKWKDKIKAIGAENEKGISAPEMKRVIQEIDKDMRLYSDKMAGEYSDTVYNNLMSMRRLFDGKIKAQVPGYAQIMEETSKMNELRGEFVKLFGSRERATSKLANLNSPKLEYERQKLQQLGEVSSKDWQSQIDDFLGVKSQSGMSPQDLRASLPENQKYVEALADYSRTQRPGYMESRLQKAMTTSPEVNDLRFAKSSLEAAQQDLVAKREALAPYKNITPHTSENMIRSLMGDPKKKIEMRKIVKSLSSLNDQDFSQMIDDLRVKEAFERGNVNGSANVNFWALAAGAAGFVLGDPTMGVASAGAASGFGKVMDIYGPKITKKVLDGIISIRGVPTVQKIDQIFADIPGPLKERLKSDLVRAVSISSTPSITVSPEERANIIQDIKNSKSLNSIEKAKSISGINQTGVVDSSVMQRVMIGDEKPVSTQEGQSVKIDSGSPSIEQVTDFVKNKKRERY